MPAVGHATFDPAFASASNAVTTQVLRFTYFTALRNEQIVSIAYATGGTAAGATPTVIRFGLYEEAANGDLTLVQDTFNNTARFAATNTQYVGDLSQPWTLMQGQRYAAGVLVVTATTAPALLGLPACPIAALWFDLEFRIASRGTTTVSALPSSITNANLSASGVADYVELVAAT